MRQVRSTVDRPAPPRLLGAWRPAAAVACSMATLVAAVPPVGAAPATVAFPPGLWHGAAMLTGGISSDEVSVTTTPMRFTFEVEIGADGSVIAGTWALSEGHLTSDVGAGTGDFTLSGSGPLEGTEYELVLTGEILLDGTVTTQGATYPVSLSVVASGGFSASAASCAYVTGDIAMGMRAAQESAGFTTSMTGPFVAPLISGDGEISEFEAQVDDYFDIWSTAIYYQQKFTPPVAADAPTVAAVVDLVSRARVWHEAAIDLHPCLEPIDQRAESFGRFVGELGQLLRRFLQVQNSAAADGKNVFTAEQIAAIGVAAQELGVTGPQALDEHTAFWITHDLRTALQYVAETAVGPVACEAVGAAALLLGFSDLVAFASTCAQP